MGSKICTLEYSQRYNFVRVRKNVLGMKVIDVLPMMAGIVDTFLNEHLSSIYSPLVYTIKDATFISHNLCEVVISFETSISLTHDSLLKLYRIV